MFSVAERELRVAARQARTYRVRLAFAGGTVFIFGWMLWLMRHGRGPNGSEMFATFSWIAFVYCLLAGAAATADSVSSERRDNTLGLLFLTHLRGTDVIFGKLLSSSLNVFFGLLAMFPVMAIPLLLGGVQLVEFGRIALNLVNTMLLSIAVGLFVSTLTQNGWRGAGIAFIVLIFLAFGLAGLGELLRLYYKLPEWAERIELFSPFDCQWEAYSATFWLRPSRYWLSLLAIQFTALIFLFAACWWVPRCWKERFSGAKAYGWKERMHRWRYGSADFRTVLRNRFLAMNPYFWRAARERVSSVEFVIFLIAFVSLASWAAWRVGQQSTFPGQPLGGFTFVWGWAMAVLHGVLLVRIAMTATHRLSEDQRNGALELVLSTPLEAWRVVRGAWLALIRQMAAPALIVLLVEGFFIWSLSEVFLIGAAATWGIRNRAEAVQLILTGGAFGREPQFILIFMSGLLVAATCLVILQWITLGWVGMWMGIRSKHPRFAPWTTLALVVLPPWPTFIAFMVWFEPLGMIWSEFQFMFFGLGVAVGLVSLHSVVLCIWAWWKLRRFLRVAVTDRYLFLSLRRTWKQRMRLAALVLAAFGGIALLIIGWRQFHNWRGVRAWTQFEAEMKRRGQPIDWRSVAPPVVPDEENFAAAPVFETLFTGSESKRAILGATQTDIASVNLDGRRQMWPRNGDVGQGNWRIQQRMNPEAVVKHMRSTQLFPSPSASMEPVDEALFALGPFAGIIEQVRDAARRPSCAVPLSGDPAPYLSVWRNIAEVLQVRACGQLAKGKITEALADLQLILRLVDALEHEPYFHALTVRWEILGFAMQVIWEGSWRWSPEQLTLIQKRFETIEPLAAFGKVCRSETLMQMEAWHRFRSEVSTIHGAAPHEERRRRRLQMIFPAGWTYVRAVRVYEFYESRLLPVIDLENKQIRVDRFRDLELSLEALDLFTENRSVKWTLSSALQQTVRMQVAVDQARLACALERYRRDQGQYPEALDGLTPKYVETIPHDAFGGRPFQYERRAEDQFILYSRGVNDRDEGGISRNELDWVWQSP